ncbi:macrophage mannose receptor 1-like [Protopterus annectens]|uniref:macrophage mannose receptor 1-like n=1 Tax=Protopterus annectens TaxID=7888 RepID=UPI001CFAAF05|nr:macrophage mannose receptor 1-like [Protopterus annectens]
MIAVRCILFLFFIQFSTTLDSGIFSIFNEDHKKCLFGTEYNGVEAGPCDPTNANQQFRWISEERLLNVAYNQCLGALNNSNWVPIKLQPCNAKNELQKWECRNDTLFALKGVNLYLNYGNKNEKNVMLYNKSGSWSRWKVFKSQDDLCSRGYEAMFTLKGNSYGQPCVFPFIYQNKWYADCTTDGRHNDISWCATTENYDKDQKYGFCPVKSTSKCDSHWHTDPLTGVCYEMNWESALTWYEARISCQQQNAELLSVTELTEQMYITGLTSEKSSPMWIGLNSLDFSSGWQWSDRGPFRYLNWAPGHPSNQPGKNCVTLHPGKYSKWENTECGHKLGYICKKGNSTKNPYLTPIETEDETRCPEGWVPFAGYCYSIKRDQKMWSEALVSCRKEEADLASVHNIEEYSFIISRLGYLPTDTLWIGLNDQEHQMFFKWSDTTPVTFTKWKRGEPSYWQNRVEDCVHIEGKDGYWSDDTCENKYGYICKRKSLPPTQEGVKIIEEGCKSGWKRNSIYCYYLGSTAITFDEANKTCSSQDAYLVTVENRFEQAFLTSLIGLRPEKYFWIGLSDTQQKQTFAWTINETMTFTHWNENMPGRHSGCVAMRSGLFAGLWDVIRCEEKSKYICKSLAEGVTKPVQPTPSAAAKCPDDWVTVKNSNHCYKHFCNEKEDQKTWFEALDFCRAIGGDLASFHKPDEVTVTTRTISSSCYYSHRYWIGLNLINPSEGFAWSDNSPVIFTEWAYGEPNNLNGVELCVEFKPLITSFWKDKNCELYNDWICQLRKGDKLMPAPTMLPVPDYNKTQDGWIIYNGSDYYFSKNEVPMEEARAFCKKNFGDLAVVNSNSERHFLWKQIIRTESQFYYIGLFLGLDKKFRWMDGSPVNFVAWNVNEPTFANSDENCVAIHKESGFWDDLNCGIPAAFICERYSHFINTTTPTIIPPLAGGCPSEWLQFDNKCYKIFGAKIEEQVSWHAARNECLHLGGNLASIKNEKQQTFLTLKLKDMKVNVWIGLNDINNEGQFLWTDGQGVYYTNWAKGFPTWYDCVAIHTGIRGEVGAWEDYLCTLSRGYICQRSPDPSLPQQSTEVPAGEFLKFENISYTIVQNKMTWEDAQANCVAKSANLASILNVYEQSFLWLQIIKYGEPVWIGLNSNKTGGQYKWINNWKLRYTKWGSSEPDINIACVYLDLDGFWKTASCDKNYYSVCKTSDGTLSQ